MSALDKTAGYPVHAVASYRRWTNPNGVKFTDWTATCGATGTRNGHGSFGLARSARRAELCRECWPAGHQTYHPEPTQTTDTGGAA